MYCCISGGSPAVIIPHVVEGILGSTLQFSLQFQSADNDSVFTFSKLGENDTMTELIRVSQNNLENVNTTWTLREDVTLDSHGERCRINVTIGNLQFPVHEGFYRAIVTGTDGTNSANLFIRTIANPEPLQLRQQPTNPTSGSDVTFTCTGNTGRPKPIVILLKSITDNEQILVQVGVDTDPVVEMLPDGRYFVNSSFVRRVSFSDNGTFFACDIRYNIGLSQRLNNATSNRVPINIAPGSAQNQLNILVTSPVRQGQDDLRITCSASGTIFTSITSYSIFRNDSSPTLKALVTRTYDVITQTIATAWPNDNQNVQGRAVLTGNSLPFPNATFIMTIPRDDISCPGDAGGYKCQFSATVTPGSQAPDPTSNQEFVEIQTNPSQMNPMTVLANTGNGNVPVTNYRFSVGTVLTLSCTGTVGNPIQSPRWCHRKTSDFGWQSPASGVSTDGAVLVGCQNSQTTTYIHNVTSEDNDRMFLCEAGSNPQCGFGDISSNITMSLGSSNAGIIAGAVIGSIAFLVIVVLIVYFVIFRRKSSAPQNRTKEDQPGRNGQPEMTREGPVYSVPHREKGSRDNRGPHNKYATENKGLDEPHEDRSPRRNDGLGHHNPGLYDDDDQDGDVVKRARSVDDMAKGSMV
ncbi:hypothetical protein FSP39_012700 [Pinctada imbricata]|uniref:Ig-like domain-containing protein n=1 Tax=Pinctada imbricata TaxID=66713 RepID=A0AA88XD92_PINIB|nr:hypothetical protein FSP39_012700 [Pinctada imbricata]